MRVLLDTNAFIRILSGDLPPKVRRRVLRADTELLVSIITPIEIAIKQSLHRIGFSSELVASKIAELSARLLPVTLAHTAELYALPQHHNDPFDRIIIAQALLEDCTLVSSDERFPLYASTGLKLLWE